MSSGRWEQHLARPRLLSALSIPSRAVVVVGPSGAGASTLLRNWAQGRTAQWAVRGDIPDPTEGVLMVDDADTLSDDDWTRIHGLLAADPLLLLRAAVHDRRAVPAELQADFVTELCFTAEETRAYLALIGSPLDAAGAHRVTGGLPAAVRAIGQLKNLRAEQVSAALRDLHPQPLEAPDAHLAVPEVLTREVVAALGGSPGVLDRAEAAGQGEWAGDPGHPFFVLSAPVRAATAAAHPTPDSPSVHARAGRTLLAQGAWYGALLEGASAGSLDLVDAALKGGGLTLIRAHGASISTALRDIRLLDLRTWPVIAMAQALIFNARREHRLRAVELMGMALIGARRAPADGADRALLRVIEAVVRRLLGLGDDGVDAALTAARILRGLSPDELRKIDGLVEDLHSHSAITLMYGDRPEDALAEFERAFATARRPSGQLVAIGGAAMVHASSGDLVAAQTWVDIAAARSWPEALLNEYQGTPLRIAEAKIALERDDLDGAEVALNSVWHIIETVEHWPTLAHLRALLDIRLGRAEVGLEEFRALRRRRGRRKPRSQRRLLDLTDSALALAAGDMASARRLVDQGGDAAMLTLGVARVEIFDGRHERAQRRLAGIEVEAPEARAHLAVLEALILRRAGRPEEAATAARRARAIADAHGLRTPFLLVPAEDRALFGPEVIDVATPSLTARPAVPRLTSRERVILTELRGTASVGEIAERLHVSENTVKSQRRSLYRKLGVSSRDEAIAVAMGQGLFEAGTERGR